MCIPTVKSKNSFDQIYVISIRASFTRQEWIIRHVTMHLIRLNKSYLEFVLEI